ncbi:lytic transglycosylase domain-containing protein [Actinorugispora endophytica]|uniref:Membrane-bound lytic murein transglycosylase B n=1 Tax=Actinorugispora endophytica TaxID=1605990 RepID=A0A4R6V0F8_9ACTN|nr:lytic murein transglycosylase [Actinorugispora endophytica]TDQ51415.1 membrane-bound lytic murein transglycosylase B [Actinorugispora endophytica]
MTGVRPGDGTDRNIPDEHRARTASPRRPLLLAGAALVAVLGATGGILGAVRVATEAATPPGLPPGPGERGGAVDTVPGTAAGADGRSPLADVHRSPSARSTAGGETVSPEWLDRVSDDTGIPRRALQGYAGAQLRLMEEQPGCRVSWPTLAAIGEVESSHGTHAGGEIADDGTTTVRVLGIPLDGTRGTAAIPDSDGGRLDGDTEWDRAVGPMQFIPETWAIWGTAADGGDADPHDIDDAALTAARYLCADGRVLTTSDGWWAGILSYNRSEEYGNDVLDVAGDYVGALD